MSGGLTAARRILPAALAGAVLWVTWLGLPEFAHGAVVTPNTSADEFDMSANMTCSLREAVETINTFSNFGGCSHSGSFASADTVELPAGHYTLTIAPTGADLNSSGDLDPGSMAIEALPGARVTIDGNHSDRILFAGGTFTLSGVTLTNGFADSPSPGSAKNGGAIFASSGTVLTISNSTISGNTADGASGIDANGPTTLTNVTVSGNTTSESGGGGIFAGGASLSLDHVTVRDNHSTLATTGSSVTSGGLYNAVTGTATIHNSVIAGNTSASPDAPAPDCQGAPLTSNGGNVIGDRTGCTYTADSSDAVGDPDPLDAALGPLADNGGTTFTHALLSGGPAIDRGVAGCASADQRGYPRPSGASCDSGAYELFTCAGIPLNTPGPFSGCPVSPATPQPVQPVQPVPHRKKCKKKKHHRGAAAAKKKCKRKKR